MLDTREALTIQTIFGADPGVKGAIASARVIVFEDPAIPSQIVELLRYNQYADNNEG